LHRSRRSAAACRHFARQVPDAATRNDLIAEAEVLEKEVGSRHPGQPREYSRFETALAFLSVVVVTVVIGVSAFAVLYAR
jgi:hypothetical protein